MTADGSRLPTLPVVVAAIALALGLDGTLAWQVLSDRSDRLAMAELRVHQFARVRGDHASRTLEAADMLMAAGAYGARDGSGGDISRPWSGHHALRDVAMFLPLADSIQMFNAAGRLIADSRQHPPPDLSVAGSRFFGLHSDGGADFNMDAPTRTAPAAPWMIPMTRRLGGPDGEFAGAMRVLISADRLSDDFDAEESPDGDRALLVGPDGLVYADSAPRGQRAIGQPLAAALPETAAGLAGIPLFFGLDVFQSEGRLVAVYRLPDFPFRLVASRSVASVLAPWRPFATTMAAIAALVLAATAGAAAMFLRQDARRLEIEDSLRLRERAMQAVGNGVVITDARDDDRILYANPAFERLTGYPLAETLGRNPRFLHGTESDQPGLDDIRHAIQTNQEVHAVIRNWRKDGTPYWCDLLITPVRDRVGQVSHRLGIQRDVSDRFEADERMRRANAELAASNAELEQFAYVASHDLQEPLRTVASYVQLLERRYGDTLDNDAHEFIGFAVGGVKRMQELIVDLLEYSRITRKGDPFRPVALDECLTAALSDLHQAIIDAGAAMDVASLPMVVGDATQLTRLFENLLANALKYRAADRRPTIKVSARRDGGMWRLSIADNGIGIAPQYHDRIFMIFQRLHTRDAYPGTGIGLAICKRIVERHGGRLWVESADGEGATFHVTLPAP